MSMIYTLKQEFKHIESKEVEEKFKNIKYDEFCEILRLFKIKKHFFKNLENREKCIKFNIKEHSIDFFIYDINRQLGEKHTFHQEYHIESSDELIKFFTDEEIKIMKEYKSRWRIQKFKMLSQNFIRYKKGKKS